MTAPRIVYLNGAFLPFEEARVPIMDRGFLFADGIYEVSAIIDGRLVDNAAHLARLDRSLGEIGIRNPHDAAGWERLQTELVARNGVTEGLVYMQVTRGVAERDFAFPKAGTDAHRDDVHAGQDRAAPTRWPRPAPRSSPSRTCAGSGGTSSRSPCWRRCSPSSRRPRPASPRPGWSRTAR